MKFLPIFDFEEDAPWQKKNTNSEVISAVPGSLKQFKEKGFFTCFAKRIVRWDRCIASKGRYFENE